MPGDSYRPGPKRPRPARPLQDRITFVSGGGDNHDSYRPGATNGGSAHNPGEFTFSSGRQGPQFPPVGPDSANQGKRFNTRTNSRGTRAKRHDLPDRPPPTGPASQRNGGRREHNNNGRGGFRRSFPYHKPAPHERALLQHREDGPEYHFGVTEGVNKFRDLADLSDNETDMELEGHLDGAADSADDSRRKMARSETARADGDSVPKWSNPDPYTVLPPPNETTGKKTDVVQLIRRAKNQAAEKSDEHNAVAANDDFISFGDDMEEEEEELILPGIPPPPSTLPPPPPSLPPPPPPPRDSQFTGSLNDVSVPGGAAWPSQPQQSGRQTRAPKRKRDEYAGGIVEEWLPTSYSNPTPWCRNRDYQERVAQLGGSTYDQMIRLFHNEILDFYDYVEPSTHEYKVRLGLIQRIERELGRHGAILADSCHVRCFGSFPANMYLPTADMDLVLVSNHYERGGASLINTHSRSTMNKPYFAAARKLKNAGIAPDFTVITKAKVPIIKFVDALTGIKVDLSMENLSGVNAQASFKKWTADHPHMFTIVALVKQFLVMRGLSDVHTGGIGGFSIICLVYMYLHDKIPREESEVTVNIAELFMGFLDFYGNQFNLATERLVMAPYPPRVVRKVRSTYLISLGINPELNLRNTEQNWRRRTSGEDRWPLHSGPAQPRKQHFRWFA